MCTGGRSTVHVDLGPEGKGRFWGKLSNELNPGRRRDGVLEKGGYAGFRNKVCPRTRCSKDPLADDARLVECRVVFGLQSRTTLFGTRTWDTSLHEFLCLRVRSSGDGMRYFVNIQTDGPSESLSASWAFLAIPMWEWQRSRLITVRCEANPTLPLTCSPNRPIPTPTVAARTRRGIRPTLLDRRPDPVLGFRIDQLGRVERPPDRDDAAESAQRRDQRPWTQGGEVSLSLIHI